MASQEQRNTLKCRPREEQVYHQFLQADLEVETIDWKEEKKEESEIRCTPENETTVATTTTTTTSASTTTASASTTTNEESDTKRHRVSSASNVSSDCFKSKKKKCKTSRNSSRTKCQSEPWTANSIDTSSQKVDLFGGCQSTCLKETNQTNYFDGLFDELVLTIFKNLSITTIVNCMQVNKRWNRLGSDHSLWRSVSCDSKHFVMEGQLGKILHRGVEMLRLSKAEVLADICEEDCSRRNDEMQCEFKLKNLDCSMSKFKDNSLSNLILNCKQLENLSLESCKLDSTVLSGVGLNTNLRILNMALCIGLNIGSLDMITRQCKQITSLNLSWTNQTRDAIRTVCRCRELRELNLSGLRGGVNRKYMELLVKNCTKMIQLDLSDVALQIGSLKLIADNLTSLTTLSISRCSDVRSEQLFDLQELRSLSHLNLFGFLNMAALERFSESRPDVHINKHTFSPIARPISSTTYEGRLWEQYVGFII